MKKIIVIHDSIVADIREGRRDSADTLRLLNWLDGLALRWLTR